MGTPTSSDRLSINTSIYPISTHPSLFPCLNIINNHNKRCQDRPSQCKSTSSTCNTCATRPNWPPSNNKNPNQPQPTSSNQSTNCAARLSPSTKSNTKTLSPPRTKNYFRNCSASPNAGPPPTHRTSLHPRLALSSTLHARSTPRSTQTITLHHLNEPANGRTHANSRVATGSRQYASEHITIRTDQEDHGQ